MNGIELISPVADSFDRLVCAPRLDKDAPIEVLLIDGMLNRNFDWGARLLDGVERLLAAPGRRFRRIIRPLAADGYPDEWAAEVLGKADLVVVAVGD
jgi:hypothetical protein